MCNGERVRKLCTVTHRGTTNVIVPGVTNTICGTCQCIINFFFLFFNLSHSLLLCNIACVCVCVHTLYQNTFQPHGPRLILPEVYSIIIFSTQTVYTHSPLPPPLAILPVQFVGEYCTLSGCAWMTLASFAVLFY